MSINLVFEFTYNPGMISEPAIECEIMTATPQTDKINQMFF